jgi:ABC-type antimicrobial peptide transport system permease subunit
MKELMLLAIRDLMKRWAVALVLASLFTITFAAYLTLVTYQKSAVASYVNLEITWLIVGSSDGLSEIHGSRLTPDIRGQLLDMGYIDPIPEIHQIVGTSYVNGTLMRGFRLEDYRKTSQFTILRGRALQPGDPSRLVMVGETLSRTSQVDIGDDLLLRGRKFRVVGIFETGSIQDNEAWISLTDAQELLGYGEDVSLFLVPEGGALKPGDLVAADVSVTSRGETIGIFGNSLTSFFKFLGMIGILAGVSTAITMANLIFRLALLRRQEFGILRSLGFGKRSLLIYFMTQSGVIILSGMLAGIILAVVLTFTKMDSFSAFGIGLEQSWDVFSLAKMAAITLGIWASGSILPLVFIRKTPIPDLLGRN